MEEIKNKNEKKDNKTIIILIIAIVIVVGVVFVFLSKKDNGTTNLKSDDVSEIISEKKNGIIFVKNSDAKKCPDCKKVQKVLDDKKINYYTYDAKKNSEKDYEKFLQSLNINPDDFNYPGVIYMQDGFMYANIINISDTKSVEQFISDYNLTTVNKSKK